MKIVDDHCHLDFKEYGNLDRVIEENKKAGVIAIITNGTRLESNLNVIKIAGKYDIVKAAIGLHPTYVNKIDKKCWLIREPYGKQQWSFLLGTYGDIFDDYKKYEFYRIDSEEGKDIFYLLNTTLNSLSEDERNEIERKTKARKSRWKQKYDPPQNSNPPPQDLFSMYDIKTGDE